MHTFNFESVACDLCGTDQPQPLFRRLDSMQVVECGACGLMYVNPRPTRSAIESWYGREYFTADEAGRGYADYLADNRVDDHRLAGKLKLALISKYIDLRKASVLELGCATGETCQAAARKGAQVTGCDLSSDAIRVAQRRYPHIKFHSAPADHLPFPSQSFDAVLAFELIEHMFSPSAFVCEVGRLLRPGGVVVLSTPNVECGRRTGWHQWTGFLTSFEHLYFFDTTSLTRMLSCAGLFVAGIYSQGCGQMSRRTRSSGLARCLRRLGFLESAKAFRRTVLGPWTMRWMPSSQFHTLMVMARKL